VWLFDILTSSEYRSRSVFVTQMLARNRTLFEKARALGGTRYPIGSLEFSHQDCAFNTVTCGTTSGAPSIASIPIRSQPWAQAFSSSIVLAVVNFPERTVVS